MQLLPCTVALTMDLGPSSDYICSGLHFVKDRGLGLGLHSGIGLGLGLGLH